MFIGNNDDGCELIESMPDVYRYGVNTAIKYLEPLVHSYGLRAVLLFPVILKSERDNLEQSEGDEEEEERNSEIISSSSSQSISSSESSCSSASSPRYVEHDKAMPADETASGNQNPFLNRNEEEEDHLLGEGFKRAPAEEPSQPPPPPPPPPPRDQAGLRKRMRELDVKLIKAMALKEKHNPVLRLIPKLRSLFPELLIICDVCLCAFTSTGHCCLFDDQDDHHQQNPSSYNHLEAGERVTSKLSLPNVSSKITCQYLAMLSVEYALRGCNVVAPSDMMDGRILIIRQKLNESRLQHVSIMSYSAKFASTFYRPFRQATNNVTEFGDRRAYQLPPGSRAMALKSVARDVEQGTDFVMVKPSGSYLDIVRDIRERYTHIPIAVYQVSGEYSMLKLAAKANLIDLRVAVNELLTSFRRAGASIIITYFTPELLRGEL